MWRASGAESNRVKYWEIIIKRFEWWQPVLFAIQTIALIVTAVLAYKIGLRQNEIASKQTQINEELLNLQYTVSAVLAYEPSTKHLVIFNLGHTNIYLAGYGIDDLSPEMQPPRLIGPGGSHYVRTADLENYILTRASGASHVNIIVRLFLSDDRQTKYLLLTTLSCFIGANQQITIDAQTSPPKKATW